MKSLMLTLCLLLCIDVHAQHLSGKTEWITTHETNLPSMPVFRKSIIIHDKIKNAVLEATALGVYDVTINGKRVGQQELKPGWTDYRKEVTYQTYNITSLVHLGANEIRFQLSRGWWAGAISRNVYGKNPPLAVMAQIKLNGKIIAHTDSSWQYSFNGPLILGDIYQGETYDARKIPDIWKPIDILDNKKINVIPFSGPPVKIRNAKLWRHPQKITIYHDTIATGTDYGIIKVDSTFGDRAFILHQGETAVVDLGQNIVGWISFKAKAKRGTEIIFRHGEMLNDNGDKKGRLNDGPGGSIWTYNLRKAKATVQYTFAGNKKGEYYHPHHTFMGFRYVSITATDDVEIDRLIGQVVGSDITEWGSFECSDTNINRLYNNIRWGQRSNFLSIPMDCPQRDERLGWTGDTQIFSQTALYNSDAKEFYRKWMRDMRNSQNDNGAYPDIAPYPNFWGYGTSAWGDAGVIVPWNVYMMTGDTQILKENYASMSRWMDYLSVQHERIRIEKGSKDSITYLYIGGGTATGDWLAFDPIEPRYVSMAYYAYVAQLMEKISFVLKRTRDYQHYQQLHNAIKNEFQKRYMNDDGTLKANTQTAYLLALHFNLLPEYAGKTAKYSLRKKIEDNDYCLSTGFVGTGLLCTTLSDCDMDDLAYSLLLQRKNPSWLYSVDQGATTIWERWDSYTRDGGFNKHPWNMNSFNHYAYGAIAEWMYAYMGGIRPVTPGFKEVILSPHADRRPANHPSLKSQPRITWTKVKTHTPQGNIQSEWKQVNNHYEYIFTLPKNMKYKIRIPGFKSEDKIIIKTNK